MLLTKQGKKVSSIYNSHLGGGSNHDIGFENRGVTHTPLRVASSSEKCWEHNECALHTTMPLPYYHRLSACDACVSWLEQESLQNSEDRVGFRANLCCGLVMPIGCGWADLKNLTHYFQERDVAPPPL